MRDSSTSARQSVLYKRAMVAFDSWALLGNALESEALASFEEAAEFISKSIFEDCTQKSVRVLDVGAGAGADIRYLAYGFASVHKRCNLQQPLELQVIAVEPNELAWDSIRDEFSKWLGPESFNSSIVRAYLELTTGIEKAVDCSCDMAVIQRVLCCIDMPSSFLHLLRQKLRPKGILVFNEHVAAERSSSPMLAYAQQTLRPAQMALCNGCDVCQDAERLLQDAGPWLDFKIYRYDLNFGLLITPHIRGYAVIPDIASRLDSEGMVSTNTIQVPVEDARIEITSLACLRVDAPHERQTRSSGLPPKDDRDFI